MATFKCPKCGVEDNEVTYVRTTTEDGTYEPDGGIEPNPDPYARIVEMVEFSCPSCNAVVATDEDDAENLFTDDEE